MVLILLLGSVYSHIRHTKHHQWRQWRVQEDPLDYDIIRALGDHLWRPGALTNNGPFATGRKSHSLTGSTYQYCEVRVIASCDQEIGGLSVWPHRLDSPVSPLGYIMISNWHMQTPLPVRLCASQLEKSAFNSVWKHDWTNLFLT